MSYRPTGFSTTVWGLRVTVFTLFGTLLGLTPASAAPGADALAAAMCFLWALASRARLPSAWIESLVVCASALLGLPDLATTVAATVTFSLCHLALHGARGLLGSLLVGACLGGSCACGSAGGAVVMAVSGALLASGVVGVALLSFARQTSVRQRLDRVRQRADRMRRYLPVPLVRRLDQDGIQPCVLERVWLVAVFVDMTGFTATAARVPPAMLEALVQSFVVAVTRVARQFGGVVMKLLGDGALVVFPDVGGPRSGPVHAAVGFSSQLVTRQFAAGSRSLAVRAGMASGECALGDWGAADVLDYSVIGQAVNLAARLQGAAEPGGILICRHTASLLGDGVAEQRPRSLWLAGLGPVAAVAVVPRAGV